MYIRQLLLVFFLLISIAVFANMAKPYEEGADHSLLFFGKELGVTAEFLKIKVVPENIGDREQYYHAQYEIDYEVSSGQAHVLPLLFIAVGLADQPLIKVNGLIVKAADLKGKIKNGSPQLYPFIKPYKGDHVGVLYEKDKEKIVDVNGLVYFEAPLKKGKNIIHVAYTASLGYNTYGFYKKLDINYALFPSKYWSSFGPIKIALELPEGLSLESASVGEPERDQKKYSWILNELPDQDLKIEVIPELSVLSKILLAIGPFGLALIAFSGGFYLHFRMLKRRRRAEKTGFNWILTIGVFLVPVLFYVCFLLAYDLIDLSLGRNALGRHGYVFLVIFSFPVFWLVYWALMWWLDRKMKPGK